MLNSFSEPYVDSTFMIVEVSLDMLMVKPELATDSIVTDHWRLMDGPRVKVRDAVDSVNHLSVQTVVNGSKPVRLSNSATGIVLETWLLPLTTRYGLPLVTL